MAAFDEYNFRRDQEADAQFCSHQRWKPFYLDVIQGSSVPPRLTAWPVAPCQTALYHIAGAVVRWMKAPIMRLHRPMKSGHCCRVSAASSSSPKEWYDSLLVWKRVGNPQRRFLGRILTDAWWG